MLGHASITATERYLEPMPILQVTAGDFIQMGLALAHEHLTLVEDASPIAVA